MTTPSSRESGLLLILVSTAVSGAVGYLIQIAVPAVVAPEDYLVFSVSWSAVFLIGSALSGVQQELSRAVVPSARPGLGRGVRREMAVFALSLLVIVVSLTSAFGFGAARFLFGEQSGVIGLSIVLGATGYLLLTLLSGVVYGLHRWRLAALITVIDAVARGALVSLGLAIGVDTGFLMFLVVLPFFITFVTVLVIGLRSSRPSFDVDTTARTLLLNTAKTVGAAIAMGLMITGLPLLIRASEDPNDVALLASTIFAITLTRAPIVIPVIALQSFIIANARRSTAEGREASRRFTRARVVAACSGLVVAILALAWAVGPSIVSLISGGRLSVSAWFMSITVFSAVLVAGMAGLGALLIARSRHGWNLAGWVVAASSTAALLFAIPGSEIRIEVALLAAPVVGLAVQLAGFVRSRRPAGDARFTALEPEASHD